MTKWRTFIRQHTALWLVIFLLLLIGCLENGQTAQRGTNQFSVELYASKRCAEPNQPITLRATVTNKSGQSKMINLVDRPVFDIVIGNPDNEAIRWSDGKPFSEVANLNLASGESKSIEMQWVSDGITHVGAQFIRDARFPDDAIAPGFIIPLTNMNCPGIGP